MAFCYDNIESSSDSKILKKELRKKYSDYCKEHKISPKSDYVVKRALQDNYGASEERINEFSNLWEWAWSGIKWKAWENYGEIP